LTGLRSWLTEYTVKATPAAIRTIAATPVGVLKNDFASVPEVAGALCAWANARGAGARVASRAAVVAASRDGAAGAADPASTAEAGGAENVIPTARARTPASSLAHEVNLRLTDNLLLAARCRRRAAENDERFRATGSNRHASFLSIGFVWRCSYFERS
jgi:hypothetical protein